MGTSQEPPVMPEVLSRLFAAVFRSEQRGDDVCGNRHDRSWLIRSPWGPGFVAQEPPRLVGSGDFSFMMRAHFPSTEDILSGAGLAEKLSKNRYCAHCGDSRIQFHAVLPDVSATLSCVAFCARTQPPLIPLGATVKRSTGEVLLGVLQFATPRSTARTGTCRSAISFTVSH